MLFNLWMRQSASFPTFVWLERVNRVYSVLGVRLPSMVRRKNLWPTL